MWYAMDCLILCNNDNVCLMSNVCIELFKNLKTKLNWTKKKQFIDHKFIIVGPIQLSF